MKIGVYGDSHVDWHIDKSVNSDESWLEILAREFHVVSHARGGSGMYYNYKSFLESHRDNDKIIFFAPSNDRLFIRHLRSNIAHITNIEMSRMYLNQRNLSELERKTLEVAVDYYQYIHNEERSNIERDLMINDIKLKRPDAIVFDIEYYHKNNSNEDIFDYDQNNFYHNHFDLRHCHFSQEVHIVLADMLKNNLINTTTEIDYNKLYNIKIAKNFDDYFVKFDSKRYQQLFKNNVAKTSKELLESIKK